MDVPWPLPSKSAAGKGAVPLTPQHLEPRAQREAGRGQSRSPGGFLLGANPTLTSTWYRAPPGAACSFRSLPTVPSASRPPGPSCLPGLVSLLYQEAPLGPGTGHAWGRPERRGETRGPGLALLVPSTPCVAFCEDGHRAPADRHPAGAGHGAPSQAGPCGQAPGRVAAPEGGSHSRCSEAPEARAQNRPHADRDRSVTPAPPERRPDPPRQTSMRRDLWPQAGREPPRGPPGLGAPRGDGQQPELLQREPSQGARRAPAPRPSPSRPQAPVRAQSPAPWLEPPRRKKKMAPQLRRGEARR